MKKICRMIIAPVTSFILGTSAIYAQTIKVVDIAGRQVEIPQNIERIAVGESRMTYAIAAVHGINGNPFSKIVAWKDDLEKYDPDSYEKYLEKFPEIKKIKSLGSLLGDVSIETVIKLDTQLVLMNLGNYLQVKESGMIKKLAKVGIPTVFVDFRQQPTRNVIPSTLLLGKVFNQQNNASKLIDFYVEQMQLVYGRVFSKSDGERPLVLMENAPGFEGDSYVCCRTFGSSNMGRFIELAGGKNLGSEFFGGLRGTLNVETVFTKNPDIIIMTGANWSKANKDTTAVLLGYKATHSEVQEKLAGLANRKGWRSLKAFKNSQFYAVYHQFYNSPYHFVAVQAFAKTFYPNDFRDVDPAATFVKFHDQFLPIDYSGIFFARYQK